MRRARLGLILGAIFACAAIAACAIDESGAAGDGGPDAVAFEGGPDADAAGDVTYDVPDLGVGETDSGLPCTCVTGVPSGYVVVEYDPAQQPGCTAGYGNDASANLYEVVQAPAAQCSCACNAAPTTAPSCNCGSDPANFSIHGGMNDCTGNVTNSFKASTANCYNAQQTIPVTGNGANYLLAVPQSPCGATGGACGQGVGTQVVPDASIEQGRTCDLATGPASCSGGGVCLPSPSSGYELCVTNHTVASCTAFADFPEPHLVGDGVVDSRACAGSCGCAIVDAGSCGDPVVELWNSSTSCTGTPDVVLDASCANVNQGNNPTFNSAHYDVAHNGGACGATGAYNPIGGAVVTNRYVICCRP